LVTHFHIKVIYPQNNGINKQCKGKGKAKVVRVLFFN